MSSYVALDVCPASRYTYSTGCTATKDSWTVASALSVASSCAPSYTSKASGVGCSRQSIDTTIHIMAADGSILVTDTGDTLYITE